MKFIKSQHDLKLKVCFSAKELATLTLSKDYNNLVNVAKDNLSSANNSKKVISKLAIKTANSSLHEHYIAFFDLYELFSHECEFCFKLKNTFNHNKDSIVSLEDLERYKEDPPDIIISYKNSLYDFEFKRYKESLDHKSLFNFIQKHIISHYSEHDRNYLIILQPKLGSELSLKVFKDLHQKLIGLNTDLGRIIFSMNDGNKKSLLVLVYPEFEILSRPFISGSQLLKKIIGDN